MAFKNYEEFWPFYLSQHSKVSTRAWHFMFLFVSLLPFGKTHGFCFLHPWLHTGSHGLVTFLLKETNPLPLVIPFGLYVQIFACIG
jgi:Protein of unknown function (DUF962)